MKHIVNNPEVIIKIDKEPEVETNRGEMTMCFMKHIVNNPEVIIKIDKEPEVEETKETEVEIELKRPKK
jgi:hypothetical protein